MPVLLDLAKNFATGAILGNRLLTELPTHVPEVPLAPYYLRHKKTTTHTHSLQNRVVRGLKNHFPDCKTAVARMCLCEYGLGSFALFTLSRAYTLLRTSVWKVFREDLALQTHTHTRAGRVRCTLVQKMILEQRAGMFYLAGMATSNGMVKDSVRKGKSFPASFGLPWTVELVGKLQSPPRALQM